MAVEEHHRLGDQTRGRVRARVEEKDRVAGNDLVRQRPSVVVDGRHEADQVVGRIRATFANEVADVLGHSRAGISRPLRRKPVALIPLLKQPQVLRQGALISRRDADQATGHGNGKRPAELFREVNRLWVAVEGEVEQACDLPVDDVHERFTDRLCRKARLKEPPPPVVIGRVQAEEVRPARFLAVIDVNAFGIGIGLPVPGDGANVGKA